MSVRLILLAVVATALAIGAGVKFSSPPNPETENEPDTMYEGKDGVSIERVSNMKKELAARNLPGEEPDIPPEFIVDVSVDPTGRKSRLYIDVSETHGYYVESFRFGIYYKRTPDMTMNDSPLIVDHFVDAYVPANGTLHACFDFVPSELNKAEGVMGSDENWSANVIKYGRYRAMNPDPLPELANSFDCD